jgi:hypothetical protein
VLTTIIVVASCAIKTSKNSNCSLHVATCNMTDLDTEYYFLVSATRTRSSPPCRVQRFHHYPEKCTIRAKAEQRNLGTENTIHFSSGAARLHFTLQYFGTITDWRFGFIIICTQKVH